MATLCLRRLYIRGAPVLRKIHTPETLAPSIARVLRKRDIIINLRCNSSNTYTKQIGGCSISFRYYTTDTDLKDNKPPETTSLLKRLKKLYRDYWYVLVPVHLVTSTAWFGGFYYMAKSGVDIAGLLESWNVSEKVTSTLKDSSMGYLAVSYALYKIATPLRYTVTLGGTTISINYLKRWGYIKPVPSRNELKEMYKEKRENLIESIREKREFYKDKKDPTVESARDTKIDLTIPKNSLKDEHNIAESSKKNE